ncbi:MAG: hypothetical protein KF893_08010 [Caldilineaceae bacterium]|nr:hypothetical protein [Caldilineaceae bacterium]
MIASPKTHRSLTSLSFVGTLLIIWLLSSVTSQTVTAQEDVNPHWTIPEGNARVFMPLISRTEPPPATPPALTCPTTSTRSYELIPVLWPPTDRPDEEHADLNLSRRGYQASPAALRIVDINGPSDGDPPQFPGLFSDGRTPTFTSTYKVYDWHWGCGGHGCRGDLLSSPEVSLVGLGTTPEEAISIPNRGAQIYVGGYKVLVLYAAEERITLGYTRDDSVAPGYAVHLEKLCVDPNLLALYRQANATGRGELPALRNGEILGTARGKEILAAIRDRGSFMEARSRKDWWRGR